MPNFYGSGIFCINFQLQSYIMRVVGFVRCYIFLVLKKKGKKGAVTVFSKGQY